MNTPEFEKWEKKVLKGSEAEKLSELEAPLLGTDSTYPMLGEDTQPAAVVERFRWTTRIVLCEAFSEAQMEALRDPLTEVRLGESVSEMPLESAIEATRVGDEGRVRVDLSLLRNVAEIRKLRADHPGVEKWVLVTEESVESDPEKLVGETIRVLTGLLGGCGILEIRAGAGEPFSSVWSRHSVARLLAHESQLSEFPDPLAGAGLFRELQKRI